MESGPDSCLVKGIVVAGTINPDYKREVPF
jgi:hypothetical protein